jgi:beta-N-acetylhexosaminidase
MRVGELFILGFRGAKIPIWLRDFAKEFGLGGVILFDYDYQGKNYQNNILSKDLLRELCEDIHSLSGRPLIFIDQEGGKVRRLKESLGFQPLPSAKEIAKLSHDTRELVLSAAFREMRELGIDCDLAPVVDLDINPENPDIGAIGRSFSAKVATVRENALAFAGAAADANVLLCLKHFPGLGGATTNSHQELTDISDSISEEQLALFYELCPEIPGQAILISHGMVRQWDSHLPVSMSSSALGELRERLPDALLISDDLQMQGLLAKLSLPEAVVQGIDAGLDMVIVGNNLRNDEANVTPVAVSLLEKVASDPDFAAIVQRALARVAVRKASRATTTG